MDFYFDFISPYAYLAWMNPRTGPRALAARYGVPLVVHPILFAGLLEKHGQLGPAEIPPKRAFLVKDVMRHAALEGIPVAFPDPHPFNPLALLRLATISVDVIDALFTLAWASGKDIAENLPSVVGAEMMARTREPEVKAALKRETDAAIARGVFGVPTFIVGDELIWGSDRAADVERVLAGADPLDQAAAAAVIARPMGVTR
jgi:2-hydroxychromene-2-carboxylate isomerase